MCCGLGSKFMKKSGEVSMENNACSTAKKCCPCRCIVKVIFFLALLFVLNTYLSFSDLAIKRYIDKNPKAIIKSIENMMKEEKEGKGKKAVENAGKVFKEVVANKSVPFLGNPNAAKVIVEFFDYNCGYCRKADSEIKKLLKANPDVKVILVNTPIMSEVSLIAAQAGIAIFKVAPEKFDDFHHRLISSKGQISANDVENAIKASVKAGQLKEVKDVMASKMIEDEIQKTYEHLQSIGIQGTPAFIVDGKLVPGYVPYEQLQEMLK